MQNIFYCRYAGFCKFNIAYMKIFDRNNFFVFLTYKIQHFIHCQNESIAEFNETSNC